MLSQENTQPVSYSPARKVVHWAVLLICLTQLPTGWAIANSHLGHISLTQSTWSVFVHRSHAIAGATVVLLLAAGVLLRLLQGPVLGSEQSAHAWLRYATRTAHVLICSVLLALSVTGFIDMYLSRAAAPWHDALVYAGSGLIGLHAAAAIWHQFVLRDGAITRIWPRRWN